MHTQLIGYHNISRFPQLLEKIFMIAVRDWTTSLDLSNNRLILLGMGIEIRNKPQQLSNMFDTITPLLTPTNNANVPQTIIILENE